MLLIAVATAAIETASVAESTNRIGELTIDVYNTDSSDESIEAWTTATIDSRETSVVAQTTADSSESSLELEEAIVLVMEEDTLEQESNNETNSRDPEAETTNNVEAATSRDVEAATTNSSDYEKETTDIRDFESKTISSRAFKGETTTEETTTATTDIVAETTTATTETDEVSVNNNTDVAGNNSDESDLNFLADHFSISNTIATHVDRHNNEHLNFSTYRPTPAVEDDEDYYEKGGGYDGDSNEAETETARNEVKETYYKVGGEVYNNQLTTESSNVANPLQFDYEDFAFYDGDTDDYGDDGAKSGLASIKNQSDPIVHYRPTIISVHHIYTAALCSAVLALACVFCIRRCRRHEKAALNETDEESVSSTELQPMCTFYEELDEEEEDGDHKKLVKMNDNSTAIAVHKRESVVDRQILCDACSRVNHKLTIVDDAFYCICECGARKFMFPMPPADEGEKDAAARRGRRSTSVTLETEKRRRRSSNIAEKKVSRKSSVL